MVFMTFVGASAAFVRNTHIRVTFVTDRLGPTAAHGVNWWSCCSGTAVRAHRLARQQACLRRVEVRDHLAGDRHTAMALHDMAADPSGRDRAAPAWPHAPALAKGAEVSAMTAVGSALLFFGFLAVLALGAPLAIALGVTGRRGDTHRGPGHHVGAKQRLRGHFQVSADRHTRIRAGRNDLRAVGVAQSIVRFASAIVGQRRGSLAITAVLVR